jgi:Tfp pilus assembly protein PilN
MSIIQKFTGRGNRGSFNNGRFAAVDWTGTSISIQEFKIHGSEISVIAETHSQWPAEATPAQSAKAAGEWLASELNRAGITATNAIVSVSRRDISLKLLEFPMVDDEELASLVLLQVESRLDVAANGQTFDFLPLPVEEHATHRHALVAAIAQSKLDQIQQVLSAAGLTIRATSVGELAIDALLPKHTNGLTLKILANHAKVEFIISHHGSPIASHAVRMPNENPAALAKGIPHIQARLTDMLPESLAANSLRDVYLLGPNAEVLFNHVVRVCDCNVHLITTQCDNAVRTLSLMTHLSSGETPINFLAPRRPADAKAARRHQLSRYAAGVAVLCALIGYWIHDQKLTLETQLVTLKQSEQKLEKLNDRGQSVVAAWQFVNEWQSSAANWSSELHAFSERLPETGRMYLTQLQLEHPVGAERPVIRADGLAKESEIAMALSRRLMASDGKYELQPNGIEPSGRDSDFRSAFRVDATIHQMDSAE